MATPAGLPFADAVVLYSPGYEDEEHACARTAEDGTFEATGLPAAQLRFRATGPGIGSRWTGSYILAPGETLENVVIETYLSGPPIRGRVTNAGKGMETRLMGRWEALGDILWSRSTILELHSDEEGNFALEGVPRDVRFTFLDVMEPDGATLVTYPTFEIPAAGEPPLLHLRVELPPRLRLRVADAGTGEGIGEALLAWAERKSSAREAMLLRAEDAEAVSDVEGRCELSRPPSSGFDASDSGLLVHAPGYAPKAFDLSGVPDGHTDVVRLDLDRGCTMELAVRMRGAPIHGAHVELRTYDPPAASADEKGWNPRSGRLLRDSFTDARGHAVLDFLPQAQYLVTASNQDEWCWSTVLVLRQHDSPLLVDAELARAGSILMRVRRSSAIVQGHTLFLLHEASGHVRSGITGDTGELEITGLPPGTYRVRPQPATEEQSRASLRPRPLDERRVVLSEGARVELELEADPLLGSIRGTLLVNGASGYGSITASPLYTPAVERTERHGWTDAVVSGTDERGAFLLDDLWPGRWEVTVETWCSPPLAVAVVDVYAGEVARCDTALTTGAVRMIAGAGGLRPFGGHAVTLRPDPSRGGVPGWPDDAAWETRFDDENGQTLEMPVGDYLLTWRDEEVEPGPHPVRIEAGRIVEIRR